MDPFIEFPWFPLWLAQVLRGFCILAAPSCVIFSARLSMRPGIVRGQKYRFAGLSFLLAATAYTEIIRWDDVVTPRLFLHLAGTIFTILGLRSMIQGRETKHV